MAKYSPIGIFDSGYGGLSVFKEIRQALPQYDYIYLGDNARVPYGTRSFQTVYKYTWECVSHLFQQGSALVILACNTASAKALRTIQRCDLPRLSQERNVLGVIRPTTELVGGFSKSGKIGILATQGTVKSESYPMEINHFFPGVVVYQEACPMWVPLIESGELDGPGTDYFVAKHIRSLLERDPEIDTLVLACTHYPLLMPVIRRHTPSHIRIISQGPLVASALKDYLHRHPSIAAQCSNGGSTRFFTTENAEDFNKIAPRFYGQAINANHIDINRD